GNPFFAYLSIAYSPGFSPRSNLDAISSSPTNGVNLEFNESGPVLVHAFSAFAVWLLILRSCHFSNPRCAVGDSLIIGARVAASWPPERAEALNSSGVGDSL